MEEAQGMMKLVEQLKEERELLSSTPSVSELTPVYEATNICHITSFPYGVMDVYF